MSFFGWMCSSRELYRTESDWLICRPKTARSPLTNISPCSISSSAFRRDTPRLKAINLFSLIGFFTGCRSVIVAVLSAWKSVLELVVAELDHLLEFGQIAAWQLRGLAPLVLVLLRPMDLELQAAALIALRLDQLSAWKSVLELVVAELDHLLEFGRIAAWQLESDSAG